MLLVIISKSLRIVEVKKKWSVLFPNKVFFEVIFNINYLQNDCKVFKKSDKNTDSGKIQTPYQN